MTELAVPAGWALWRRQIAGRGPARAAQVLPRPPPRRHHPAQPGARRRARADARVPRARARALRHGRPTSRQMYAVMFATFMLRAGIFFTAAALTIQLFRNEALEKTLHYYLLAPVRRGIVVAGKFLAAAGRERGDLLLRGAGVVPRAVRLARRRDGALHVRGPRPRPPARLPRRHRPRLPRLRRRFRAVRPAVAQPDRLRGAAVRLGEHPLPAAARCSSWRACCSTSSRCCRIARRSDRSRSSPSRRRRSISVLGMLAFTAVVLALAGWRARKHGDRLLDGLTPGVLRPAAARPPEGGTMAFNCSVSSTARAEPLSGGGRGRGCSGSGRAGIR